MKKTNLFLLLVIMVTGLRSQVTLNCESGNIGIETGNCWSFHDINYSNSANKRITGAYSIRTGEMTHSESTETYLKTPWMRVGSGNITFKAKFDGTSGNSRGIKIYFIPYNANQQNQDKDGDDEENLHEGTAVLFYSFTFPKPYTSNIQNFSVSIPITIENSSTDYKIRVSFVGSEGSSRLITDDYVFPGTYWGDPSNGCLPLPNPVEDEDEDGVPNGQDATPTNPRTSYFTYFPSFIDEATLAFEDMWPARGDYDFNDVVVNYRLQTVINSANNVVEVNASFVLRASGASFHNGFGFQLDGISPNKIISVTGTSIGSSTIHSFAPNGLEAGQNYATCIVFDDFYNTMPWPGGGSGINTTANAPFAPYVTLNVRLVLIDENNVPASGGTVSNTELTPDVFNFFIVVNQDRGREVHLADRLPTSLVNSSYFGTLQDDSNPTAGKYYKSSNNLPWGINILQGFDYPIEKAGIDSAYNHFVEWAASSGNNFADWFMDLPGYRNSSLIY